MMNDETEIIKQLKAGKEEGVRALFDQYYTPLCLYALKFIDDFEKAEDIVQEVFIHFWEHRPYNYSISNIKAYLFTAVRNNSLNYLRKIKQYKHELLDEQFELLEDNIDNYSELDKKKVQLYAELDLLPPQSKAIFERIIFEGMKYKEVANELNVSVNTVKTLFSRTLKRLRSSVEIIILLFFV